MAILVTGGAGYIGSHTVVQLLNAGQDVLVLDNLCNSKAAVMERIAVITGKKADFIEGDVRDAALLQKIFSGYAIDSVIHFAGLKAVGESVSKPLSYYDNNLACTFTLLKEMECSGVKTLVFSSSATVYGDPQFLPLTEGHPLGATNPYGQTKQMIEQILRDCAAADPSLRIALLRYFNPVGAHVSGLIGEDPAGKPNNLMPYVAQVAVGKLTKLQIFGDDYATPDGTGVRDYIHVDDLASGHLAALHYLQNNAGIVTVNLGTGMGSSVKEMIKAFETASKRNVPFEVVSRRPGDIASCYANSDLAFNIFDWKAEHDIDRMCQDSWRWQSQNPKGFAD